MAFWTLTLLVPAGTPFAALGRWNFDGKGNFTNTLTFNDNGTVTHADDFGPYTVNADCTGQIGIRYCWRTLIHVILVS